MLKPCHPKLLAPETVRSCDSLDSNVNINMQTGLTENVYALCIKNVSTHRENTFCIGEIFLRLVGTSSWKSMIILLH